MVNAECLPTEIWFEIFSYLRPRHNIKAFLNLNQFFNRFASTKYFGGSYCIKKHQCKRNSPKSISEIFRFHTIRSIIAPPHVSNVLLDFLCRNADNLIQLRKMSIYLRGQTMIQAGNDLADVLIRLPSLRSIEIRLRAPRLVDWEMKDFLIILFSKRLALTHCNLLFSLEDLSLPLFQWTGPSSIRHLSITKISWFNLCAILSQMQNLVYLNVLVDGSQCESAKFILPSLRKIVLSIDKTPFALLNSICRLAPEMNFFLLRGSLLVEDDQYFQMDLWSEILEPIDFYDVILETLTCEEDEKILLTGIRISLGRTNWFKIRMIGSSLRGEILFRSK